ncbi:MAG: tRNA (adenosine(37)-N6)-threonylcarbamoyltransferase complex ATPase subunit type 1 TsaE [Bacillota bacterium]
MDHFSDGIECTFKIAAELASTLKGGEVILLNGDLGAGKTTFTKGLAKALGIARNVSSPTFTIIKEYGGGRLFLYHIDMYRIEDCTELEELGIEDVFRNDAVTVIEWNKLDKIDGNIININIEKVSDNSRIYHINESNNN